MRPTFYSRTLFVAIALFFSVLTCIGQDDSSDQVVGAWEKEFGGRTASFTLTSENTYQVEFTGDDEVDVYGSYVISGVQITFTDEGGDYSSDSSGVYEFKLNDTSLSFSVVDDPVDGRSMLVQGTWSLAAAGEE